MPTGLSNGNAMDGCLSGYWHERWRLEGHHTLQLWPPSFAAFQIMAIAAGPTISYCRESPHPSPLTELVIPPKVTPH